ncbi:MAG: hypothetical protein ACK52I_29665 [Pseudomonadota bacterium]
MAKFKAGDLVRCLDSDDAVGITKHTYYMVMKVSEGYPTITIRDDDGEESEYLRERFELVPQTHSDLIELPLKYVCVNELCQMIHASNRKAGWWDAADNALVVPTKLALVHSELSEALESHRKNTKDDKLPQYDGIAVELADAVIRIFDLAGFLGIPLGTIMAEKEAFNAKREDHKVENRAKPQGKRY